MTEEQRKALAFVLGFIDKSESCAPYKWQLHELLKAARATPVGHIVDVNKKVSAESVLVPIELADVARTVAEGDGFWTSCSGCYETEDGHPVGRYPHSTVFNCTLGSGCSECGGLGAVWDNTDYAAMADAMMQPPPSEAQGGRDAAPDTERLDYLDKRNARANARNRTTYGWRLNENHNRIALEDHAFPAVSVREAIDQARKDVPL